ncbi:hypothetical protein C9975_01250 [Thalassospira xiamenensis]|nr:hypothetical protein C9939_00955 [Pseudidiomarina aestuarii]PTC01586.1 hypothetical protein C9975_01250 [Thalassospira xiamenensis]
MPAFSTRHLVVLDDDPDILELISSAAQISDFNAYATTEPDDFLNSIERIKPDIVIIDLIMPKQDGIEILQRLAQLSCPLPRLVIASGAGSRVLDAAKRVANELGLTVIGILTKPFRISTIRDLLLEEEKLERPVNLSPRYETSKNTAIAFQPDEVLAALSSKQLAVYFQPKICCKSGRLKGFESLARLHHPQYGVVLPDSFIGIAESSGYIWQLTEEVLHQALTLLANINRSDLSVSINLSPRLLDQPEIVEFITRACREFNIATDRVIFEITESSTNDNAGMVLNMLTRLRVRGFRLSIDDFGVGFSSLVQLSQLPFSEIKIDKSFVLRLEHSDEAAKIIKTIVALGEGLSLEVVAEGVENINQLKILAAYGCNTAQGFYIGTPMPIEIIHSWINGYQPIQP